MPLREFYRLPAETPERETVLGRGELIVAVDVREALGEADPAAAAVSMHAFGASFAEVAVDADLGEVRVRRFVACYGAGRILNAKMARSQQIGGIVFGIGMALGEATRLDAASGRITNARLTDYLLPVHADVPDIDVSFVAEDDPHVNATGVKGIGMIGAVGVARRHRQRRLPRDGRPRPRPADHAGQAALAEASPQARREPRRTKCLWSGPGRGRPLRPVPLVTHARVALTSCSPKF